MWRHLIALSEVFTFFFCWISGLCWIIGFLSGWVDNVRNNVLAIDYVAALFSENFCYHCKQQCFIYVTLKKISNLNFLLFLALCLFLLLFIKQNPFTLLLRAWLHEGRAPQVGEVTRGKLPHLTCKRDHIKMRDYMDKRVTSPTWGAPRSGAWKLFMWRFVSREAGISIYFQFPNDFEYCFGQQINGDNRQISTTAGFDRWQNLQVVYRKSRSVLSSRLLIWHCIFVFYINCVLSKDTISV